jgi:hypothetical protein
MAGKLKLFKEKLSQTREGTSKFKSKLNVFESFLSGVDKTQSQSYAQVILEASGLSVPLPSQAQVVIFYEEIKDPNNILTTKDPKEWTSKEFLQYQTDVRKFQLVEKYKTDGDDKLEEVKEEEKKEAEVKKAKTKFFKLFFDELGDKLFEQIPEDLKPRGAQKITGAISLIIKGLIKVFIPTFLNILESSNLPYFKEKQQEILTLLGWTSLNGLNEAKTELLTNLQAKYCPNPSQLSKIIQQRNGIVEYLNNTQTKLTSSMTTVNIVGDIADTSQQLANIFTQTVRILNTAAGLFPLIPGAVVAIINSLEIVKDTIIFKNDGQPRIPPLQRTISNISIPFNQANSLITKIVLSLSAVDDLIAFCRPEIIEELTPLSAEVMATVAIQLATEDTDEGSQYKGFRLEIETRAFTDTVNQNRALGINSSGIALISGEWSFASDPNVLLQEIKFIIDRDNLKAY